MKMVCVSIAQFLNKFNYTWAAAYQCSPVERGVIQERWGYENGLLSIPWY